MTGLTTAGDARAQTPVQLADFEPLAARIEEHLLAADAEGLSALLQTSGDRREVERFARDAVADDITRVVVRPQLLAPRAEEDVATGDRDRDTRARGRERVTHELTLDVFSERGDEARLDTWALGLARDEEDWVIASHRSLGGIDNLYHLTLREDIQLDAANLVIAGEDLTLRMRRGAAFVAEIDDGVTALVLIGDGTMTFEPKLEAERGQVRIFSGSETLHTDVTGAFLRVNPEMFAARVSTATLTEVPVDGGDLRQARELFDEMIGLSYLTDLSEFSDRGWWLKPGIGDILVEVVTRRYGPITYVQSPRAPEDISLFQREPNARVISLYPSAAKLALQGRYFDDQDGVAYDVLDYDIVASFEPRGVTQETLRARPRLRGCWIEGTTRLAVRLTRANTGVLTLRLADELSVRSVRSRELGPLPFFRMSGQRNVIVTLPSEAPAGTELTLVIRYAGLLPPQEPDENWIGRSRHFIDGPTAFGVAEPRYLYSSSSHWYPQSTVADYATATMTLTVPGDYGVVASGDATEGNPPVTVQGGETGTRTFQFVTLQPAKYLSTVITRFAPHDVSGRDVTLRSSPRVDPTRPGVRYRRMSVAVQSNPRTRDRLTEHAERTVDILEFYADLVGDLPYPSFTLALTDSYLPGGHSPAYFAVLNQPLPLNPGTIWSWRTDPVAFSDVDYFFLAHELAHQWWGQAVGWKNYHEQWLSEAISHYFAALYVQAERGDDAFADVLAQMRRWSRRHADEGPVYLGYRLGLIEDEPRVYRSVVYNKGALVLHMLRRLIGDDAFFAGLRRYYHEMRFRRAGTDDLIRAFEIEAARSLERFFDRWIHESDLPRIRFRYHTEASAGATEVVLRFEQVAKVFEIPVAVTMRYRSGLEETTVVPVTERVTEIRLPLTGALRDVGIDRDESALVEIEG